MQINEFGWVLKGNFSLTQTRIIFETGYEISRYIDNLTRGNGHAWLQKNLGNVVLVRGGLGPRLIHASFVYPYNQVNLATNFEDCYANSRHYIAHELGHVLDNNNLSKGKIGPATFFGNGPADALAAIAKISPSHSFPRWRYNHPTIPKKNRFPPTAWGGYGNFDTADYFAESFSRMIFDPENMPKNGRIKTWMNAFFRQTAIQRQNIGYK